jgi:hypothetical protein
VNARYQEWLKHIFDHEVKEHQWYFEMDAPGFEASPTELVELIGQTFLRSGKDLIKYTDEQVNQGIWYLAGSSGSNFMSALKSSESAIDKTGGSYWKYFLFIFRLFCQALYRNSRSFI